VDLRLDFDPFAAGKDGGVVEFKLFHCVWISSDGNTNVCEMKWMGV